MAKIDRRKRYLIMLDTETANGLEDSLVYDAGWAIIDKRGKVYKTRSFVNRDIFNGERDIMRSAYYAEKIPRYVEDLRAGKRIMADWWEIVKAFREDCAEYRVKVACAHNARFDLNALNTTQRWITKSKFRFFFPYGMEIWDTMKMAQDVISPMPTYSKFCQENGYITATGRNRITAEILYRFISAKWDFVESHTGLEDVFIEKEILSYCFRQHKRMRKKLFENRA